MAESTTERRSLPVNVVKRQFNAKNLALGTYVTLPTEREVDVLSRAGLDFVRLDFYRFPWTSQILTEMVQAALTADMTPWARVNGAPANIEILVHHGIQIITVPEINSSSQAAEVVAATRSAISNDPRIGTLSKREADEYERWAASEILVGCQIETSEGIANFREIIAVDGVDIIHTGRTDISNAIGVPGEQFHPRVLEVERRIVEATLEAGKQPSLLYPVTEEGLSLAVEYARMGVRVFALDMDYRVLHRVFIEATNFMRRADSISKSSSTLAR